MKRFGFLILLLLWFSFDSFANIGKKQIRLRILDTLSSVWDETNIYLDLGASPNFIYPEDGQKIIDTSSAAPYIYSYTADNVWCFSNSYGNFTTALVIPVGFRVGNAGTFTFTPTLLDNFDGTSIIRLEDRTLGIFHDLRQGSFNLDFNQALTDNNRFFIHVSYPAQINLTDAGCNNDNGIISVTQDTSIAWTVCGLYDDSLNLLASYNNINGTFNFSPLPEGEYNLLFGYGVYAFTKPISLHGHQVLVAANASKYFAVVDESIHFSVAATNATQYTWDFGDGTFITGVTNADYSFNFSGTYLVTASCYNIYGCSAIDTFTVYIETASGVSPVSKENFSVSAENKTLHVFNSSAEEKLQLELYNMNGQLLRNDTLNSSNSIFNLQSLSAGVYLVKIKSATKSHSQKIMLN